MSYGARSSFCLRQVSAGVDPEKAPTQAAFFEKCQGLVKRLYSSSGALQMKLRLQVPSAAPRPDK